MAKTQIVKTRYRPRFKVILAQFMVGLFLCSGLFSVLAPALVSAQTGETVEHMDDGHYVLEGKWIDRGKIQITKFELTDDEYLNTSDDDIKALGRDEVNARIATTLGDGFFTSDNISPDSEARGKFYKDSACGSERNMFTTDSLDDTGNPTSDEILVNSNNFYIKTKNPNKPCGLAIAAKGFIVNADRSLAFNLADGGNRNIWFRQVPGEPTLNRVDGKEDGFKKFDEDGKQYIQKSTNGCAVRVEFPATPTTAGTHQGFYETCDVGNNLVGGDSPSIVGFVKAVFSDEEGMNREGSPVDEATGQPSCESQNSNIVISWLVCGIVGLIDTSVQSFGNAVDDLLNTRQEEYDQDGIKVIWEVIKNFATFLLIAIALVMILSQALDFGPFDAYTIRKVLPRLIIAVIGMQLSWFIFTSFIQIVNDIAWGLEGIMYAPFGGRDTFTLGALLGNTAGGTGLFAALAASAAVGAGIAAISLGGILALGATALLGLLLGFMTLVLRKIVLIMLLVMAPLALVAWILPNTDKYWKLWWESFSKLLLMYPMIILLIGAGRIFAYTAANMGDIGRAEGRIQTDGLVEHIANNGLVTFVFVVIGFFAPYFLIPKTFQIAGSAFGNLTGMINNRKKGAFDRLANSRQKTQKQNAEKIMDNKRWKGNNAFTKALGKNAQRAALLPKEGGWNVAKWGDRVESARSRRTTALSAKAAEHEAMIPVIGNDDMLRASLHKSGSEADVREYLQGLGQRGGELNQNVAAIMAARASMGRENYEDFAATNLAGTGTGYASGPAEMLETINKVANGDSARAARMLVKARGEAERAKRVDLYGAGMATSADQLSQLAKGQTNAAAVNEVMTDEALNSKSAAEIGQSRNNALTNMAGAVQRRMARAQLQVDAARSTGDPHLIETAEHVQKQAFAATSAFLDYAGGDSPENQQIVGAIMGQKTGRQVEDVEYVRQQARDPSGKLAVDSTTNLPVMEMVKVVKGMKDETVGARIESLEGDAEFKQYKKTYSSDEKAAAAQAAQNPGGPTPPSDRRLKTNIKHLQTLSNGIKLYSFEYIWGGPVYVGVMAQDLLDSHPQAVVTDKYGYYAVNYALLGLKMVTLQEYQQNLALVDI